MVVVKSRMYVTTAASIALAAALSVSMAPRPASAQGIASVVPSMVPEAAEHTVYAKIQAIDPLTRQVTLTTADGRSLTVIASPDVSLDRLEVGDRADVHYYRSVAFLVSKTMSVPKGQTAQLPPEQAELLARHQQAQIPGGMTVPMTQISGLVVGVQPGTQTVEVVNPSGGGVYSIQASDPSRAAMLNALKVGDVVTAVVSPQIATSIEPEPGLFRNFSKLFGSQS